MNFTQSKIRLKGLDVLRFFAITLVILSHLSYPNDSGPNFHFYSFLSLVGRVGDSGVILFFVLSGFLVSGLLFDELKKTSKLYLGYFYYRRAFRILPPFYLLLITSVIHDRLLGIKIEPSKIIPEFFLFQSYFPHLLLHSWTLAVEEHYYFVIGLLIFSFRKLLVKKPYAFVMPISLVSLSLWIFQYQKFQNSNSFSYLTHIFASHFNTLGFSLGVSIAVLFHFYPDIFQRIAFHRKSLLIFAMVSGVVGFSLRSGPLLERYCFSPLPLSLCFSSLLIIFISLPENICNSFLVSRMAHIGRYSYSIYLWHLAVPNYFGGILNRMGLSISDPRLVFWIGLLSPYLFGMWLDQLIEKPLNQLRDWFWMESKYWNHPKSVLSNRQIPSER